MTSFNRMIFFAMIASVSFTITGDSDAAQKGRRQRYSAQRRAEIRAMPILERPSRPGHFYGNTVRRNAEAASSKSGVSRKHAATLPASIVTGKSQARAQVLPMVQTQGRAESTKQPQPSAREKITVDGGQAASVEPAVTARVVASPVRSASTRGRQRSKK